jgi:excisionase family DNA binding protein
MTKREVAQMLRISEDRVTKLIKRGEIPATKPFGKVLIPDSAIREKILKSRIRPSADGHPARLV